MFESTVKLSSETDASFYNAEAFEMHIQTVLFSSKDEGTKYNDCKKLYVDGGGGVDSS